MSFTTDIYVFACLTDKPSDIDEIYERMGMLCHAVNRCPFTKEGTAKALGYLTKRRLAVEPVEGRWKRGELERASAYRDETERVREMRRERFKAQGKPYYYEEDPIGAEERDKERERLSVRARNSAKPWRMP